MLCAPCALRFFIKGAVAQLGERQNRTLEAAGSIPVCSTKNSRGPVMEAGLFSFEQILLTSFYYLIAIKLRNQPIFERRVFISLLTSIKIL